ncbi:uncharacterized protein LOC126281721 [Schistocerca gregaria]|uniref:uncharacterized protein LOC126281721 n=1 Tax=Schistocerca gregaria TaxID=7010 RepID=UPI00211E8536|nr:uncharacterized protein LOC126281721 [Schistocerca gregaria]
MWPNDSDSKYRNYWNSKHIVSGKATRSVSGGRSEILSPNYGATAPVMHSPHLCQMSRSRLPLKMVVSDVVHRDFGALQQPSSTPSRFIITPKKRSSPYDYYKNVVHRRSHTPRNHPIVEEMQKKFNSMYGHHFQNATSDTSCASTSLAHESPMETDSTEQESSIPKFSNFYKEYLQKQQSTPKEMKISDSHLYCNTDKYTSEENEIENDERNKDGTNKGHGHFMLAENFLHTIEERPSVSNKENDSPPEYSKTKSDDECSSSSSQEYSSQNDNFCFSPLLEGKEDGVTPSRDKMTPKTWTVKHNSATADSKRTAGGKIDVLSESPASDTSEEDSNIWFADEDHNEDLN